MKSNLKTQVVDTSNNKGFSLVELLIVIAIMGVLAVIAFNAFSGVLGNSKKRADDATARIIEKAVFTFCTETGVFNPLGAPLSANGPVVAWATALPVPPAAAPALPGGWNTNTHTFLEQVIMRVGGVYYKQRGSATYKSYGPYLTKTDPTAPNTIAEQFAPQGTGNLGYHITFYTVSDTVAVTVSTALPALPTVANS